MAKATFLPVIAATILSVGCTENKSRYQTLHYYQDSPNIENDPNNPVYIEITLLDTYTGDVKAVFLNRESPRNKRHPDSTYVSLGFEYDNASETFRKIDLD